MKRTSFRTASTGPVRKLGASVLLMGLALSAAAKDGSGSGNAPPPLIAKSKASPKPKHRFQIGVASWYGTKFQGRTTAGGERFDMNQMTCAHRSLPMGTWLRVTNLKNHKTAFVRVNDRGPILDDRIVDLSMAAAKSLGLAGLGQVSLEAVSSGDPEIAQGMLAQLQMPVALLTPGR